MPARSKFTQATRQRVLEAKRIGASDRTAAHIAGIDHSTLGRWLARGKGAGEGSSYRAFHDEFRAAEAEPRLRALAIVHEQMPDNPSLAWKFIERREDGYAPPAAAPPSPAWPPTTVIQLKLSDGRPLPGLIPSEPITVDSTRGPQGADPMTVREDLDGLANEAQEAALRAQFGRLSTPAAIALAEDCVDTATGLIEAGKLICGRRPRHPSAPPRRRHLEPRSAGLRLELRRLGQTLATYAKSRRGSVRVKATPPPKSQEQLHAERVRRGEREAMRQQGVAIPYDADELQERARAEAQERQRQQREAAEQARLVA